MFVCDDYELSEIFDHRIWIMEFLIIYLFENMLNVHFTEYIPFRYGNKVGNLFTNKKLGSTYYDT